LRLPNMDRSKAPMNARMSNSSSIPTYKQSLNSALRHSVVTFSTPASGMNPVANGMGTHSGMPPPHSNMGTMPYMMPPPMQTNNASQYSRATSRVSRQQVACFDTRYAKSRQGILKVVQFILVMIAWICIACTPYMKRLFVQGATWPFHFVMFFAITGWLALLAIYIMFTSGFHRRRKRKPWPTYELYFNVTMLFWFFTAAMIESFNVWRWNYGPYKQPISPSQSGNPGGMYGADIGMNNQHYYNGWDYKQYCRQRPTECHEFLNALVLYNPYFPAHIMATICLWVTFCVFIGSSYHAYTLHVDYKMFIENGGTLGDNSGSSVVTKTSSKFTVGRMKKKHSDPKPKSGTSYVDKSKKTKSGSNAKRHGNRHTTTSRSNTSGKSRKSQQAPPPSSIDV